MLSLGIALVIMQLLVTIVLNNRLRDTEETKEQPLNDCVLALLNSIILMCSVICKTSSKYRFRGCGLCGGLAICGSFHLLSHCIQPVLAAHL